MRCLDALCLAALSMIVIGSGPTARAATGQADIGSITIVQGNGPADSAETERVSLAAHELAGYLSRMGGLQVKVIGTGDAPGAGNLIVVGNAEQNALTRELADAGVIRLDIPQAFGDAFVVRSGERGDAHYLVLAGESGVATLYAVYDYLEKMCDVGFFMDGERVPSRASIPFKGVDYTSKPFFRDRHFQTWFCYGLKKYWARFKTNDEMDQWLSWLAKRKFNRTGYTFNAYPDWGGLASVNAFDYKLEPVDGYGAGWPGMTWDLDPARRTQWLQTWLAHARRLGFHIMYSFNPGEVTRQYRQAHPDQPYVPNLGYEANVLMPGTPEAHAVSGRYLREVIRLYGTDHLYACTPFCESVASDTPEGSFKIKMDASRDLNTFLGEIDPQYHWIYDSWDFGANPAVWTPERISQYVTAFPNLYIYDTAADVNPFWQRTGYFGGADWAFGILHSFQGDDHLHGNMADVEARVKSAVHSDGAATLRGLYLVPESAGHNILFYQFVTALAWDPDGVTLDDFLSGYALRRYGPASAGRMRVCLDKVVQAVQTEHNSDMYYQRIGILYNPVVSPPFDDLHANFLADKFAFSRQIPLLEEAVRIAVEETPQQEGNTLFENDLVDFTRTMLGIKSNLYLIRAYEAFKAGVPAAFEEAATQALQCLTGIEMILSTRPDFSVAKMIDEVMAIPGTNPMLPRMIRKGCMNDMYANGEVYEQLSLMYRPKVEAYLEAMRTRMAAGETTLPRACLNEAFNHYDQKWWDEPAVVSRDKAYKGSTLEAVKEYYRIVPFGQIQPVADRDLAEGAVLICTPDQASSLLCLPMADGPAGATGIDGVKAWRLGGDSGLYLYFRVAPEAALNCTEGLVLSVTYLDAGEGGFLVQYDSAGDHYKATRQVDFAGSGLWKTVEFRLKDASCTKGQNGQCDFRIQAVAGRPVIARVAVASSRVAVIPTFDVVQPGGSGSRN